MDHIAEIPAVPYSRPHTEVPATVKNESDVSTQNLLLSTSFNLYINLTMIIFLINRLNQLLFQVTEIICDVCV